ncbi:sensor histidine kinase [Anaerocolumna jejuensis]|uniref:sensor histidine kinase n=1 Tax=Anaerocolumna jejuensis TaxID=259063 RepID=UPI003F7C13F6
MKKKNSLINRVIFYIILFTALLLILLIIVWEHSRSVMKNNTIDATKRTLSIFINNMENVLANSDRSLRITMNSSEDIYSLGSDKEATHYYAAVRLREVLDNVQLNNQNVDVLVIYNGEQDIYLSAESTKINYKNKIAVKEFVKNIANDNVKEAYSWEIVKIGSYNYFARIFEKEHQVLASFIKVDNFMKEVRNTKYISNQYYALINNDGSIAGSAGQKVPDSLMERLPLDKEVSYSMDKKYLIVTMPFFDEAFHMACFIRVQDIYGKMQFIQYCIFALIILSIAFIVKFAYYVNQGIFHPIKDLLKAMNAVEQGEYDYRISNQYKSKEFDKVTNSFNSMIEEIVKLKIETYEEKIQLQEAELRYVHLQIKPHFFLNAMTTIHSMSYQNRNEDIRAYIDALSKNVRYIFRAGLYTVTIKEEISHIEDYFQMQNLLYPDCVFYYIDAEEEAKEWKIPQLLLHTFIENEFKHAVSLNKLLSIFIRIQMTEQGGRRVAHITIEDDGTGFPDTILDEINTDYLTMKKSGHGVGLWNVKKTMELLYKRTDLLKISNNEIQGAKIEIWLPEETFTEGRMQ